jgi:hypothetical protein
MAWRLVTGSSSEADTSDAMTTMSCWILVWQTGQTGNSGESRFENASLKCSSIDY